MFNTPKTFFRGSDKILVTLSLIIIFIGLCINYYVETQTTESISGVVTDTYIKRVGYGKYSSDHFHVVVEKGDGSKEIFWNDDSLFNLKFNSADVQQQMQIGKKYTFKVYGYRVGFFSWFRNIIEVKPLE